MDRRSKIGRLIYIGIVINLLCNGCGSVEKPRQESAETGFVSERTGSLLSDTYSRAKTELSAADQTYFIKREAHLNYPSSVYHIGEVEMQPYYVPVLLVEIPEDAQKEERINRMLLEHYVEKLPDAEEEDWWQMQEIQITYRSERYFCFQYVSPTALPEGCSYNDLYITLDLEAEKLIPYPALTAQKVRYNSSGFGELYKEMEAYQEKTVAEQNILRGEQSYEVQGVMAECDGISFPGVRIAGLADEEKQDRINVILQEPIRTFIMTEGWEDEEEKQALFDQIKIYIAYKSEEWLSVVYSVRVTEFGKWDDGMADFGVTIDLQNAERVMLGDLFEIDGLMTWMYACGRYKEKDSDFSTLGLLLTEEELLTQEAPEGLCYKGKELMERYMHWWDTFYLYEGKLVLTGGMGLFDFEIPLPEIFEYLKVDPWYG